MGARVGLCIKVSKDKGELFRRLAIRHNIFDPSRKPRVTEQHLIIPITKRPSQVAEAALRELAPFSVSRCSLPTASLPSSSIKEVLEGLIPKELLGSVPKSYDVVGDIVVIEGLPGGLAKYKREIGKALLKINKNARTCLLKVGRVEGEWRIPTYEVIAGMPKFETEHLEYGMRMRVDLSKVYFSPRLGNERQRIAGTVHDGETVVDMFAGVGPFSLAIAKRVDATVYAIDLNPDAIGLLEENIAKNKLKGRIVPICGDAREASKGLEGIADHVIMNLPSSSLAFLDTATSLLKPKGGVINLYTFSKDDLTETTERLVAKALTPLCRRLEIRGSRVVKEVAPRKWQIAVTAFCAKSEM